MYIYPTQCSVVVTPRFSPPRGPTAMSCEDSSDAEMDGDELMWKGIKSGAKCAGRRLKKGQEAEGDKYVRNVWRKERKRRQKQQKV